MNSRVALIGVVIALLAGVAFAQQVTPPGEAAQTTHAPVPLDGRWLRSGLQVNEQHRANDPAATSALAVLAYVRGVIDVTNLNISKALMLDKGFQSNQHDAKKQKATTGIVLVTGMWHLSYQAFVPLWNTAYATANLQMDQIDQIVLNFLDAHPEKWDADAHELIISALADKFPAKTE